MNSYNIVLALPIFFVLYSIMGLLLNMHKRKVPFGMKREGRMAQTFREFAGAVGDSSLNQAILKMGNTRATFDELLMRTGYPFGWKAGDVLFIKEFSIILTGLILWQMGADSAAMWIIGLALGFILPDLILRIRAGQRKGAMQRALPGFVDLLALAIESGLDLVVAIERITEKMTPGALKEELQAFIQESRLGSARRDTLQRWAHRTGLADAQALSSLVIQSEQMGTPLSNVLRNYGEDMRSRRILRAEEMAGKIPVKILLPMMVFFFPIVFVIILGPVALDLMKNYR